MAWPHSMIFTFKNIARVRNCPGNIILASHGDGYEVSHGVSCNGLMMVFQEDLANLSCTSGSQIPEEALKRNYPLFVLQTDFQVSWRIWLMKGSDQKSWNNGKIIKGQPSIPAQSNVPTVYKGQRKYKISIYINIFAWKHLKRPFLFMLYQKLKNMWKLNSPKSTESSPIALSWEPRKYIFLSSLQSTISINGKTGEKHTLKASTQSINCVSSAANGFIKLHQKFCNI